ncbi:MAG: hypothetical protein ACM3ZA_13670 [Bacillota bacterium]
MDGWKSMGKSPVMRFLVFAVVLAMLLGALFVPISVALGEDKGGLEGQLGVEVTHLVLTKQEGSLSVFHMLQLVNNTAQDSGPLTIPLPEGAQNLSVVSGLKPDQVGEARGGFVDKPGVPAGGSQQLALRYELPVSGDAFTLRFQTSLPTNLVYILTDPKSMTMPPSLNTGFGDGGSLDMQGRILRQYVLAAVKAGDSVQVNLQFTPDQEALAQAQSGSQLPPAAETSAPPASNYTATIIVLVATGVLVLLALVLIWRRLSTRLSPTVGGSVVRLPDEPPAGGAHIVADEASLLQRKTELVNEIARLDQRFAAGDMDEAEHARRREAYKQELVSVLLQLKDLQG